MTASLLATRRPLSLLAATAASTSTGSSAAAAVATAHRTLRTATSVASQGTRNTCASLSSRRSFTSTVRTLKPPTPQSHASTPSASASASAPPPPSSSSSSDTGSTTLTRTPSAPEEPSVLQGGAPSIVLLPRGASRLDEIAQKEGLAGVALRVEVMPGGCHGYQYAMSVEEGCEGEEDDFRFTSTHHPRAHLLIDSVSLRLLKGATIDYATELIGSQFVVKDNPQSKGAGCGCGVSWEPIEGAI